MPRAVPLLMVLYSNDAVEIRYSDGSTLQLSACGSTMIHHEATSPRKRGSTGTIHKRSRYVTSEHRYKVLQAMDFRNRFAERPYLCKELLDREQIVALYAQVDTASWCTTPSDSEIDLLEDGSRKINSLDGYASLIISPHGHDFTVCYLSKISSEHSKPKPSMQKSARPEMVNISCNYSHSLANSSKLIKVSDPVKAPPLNSILKSNEAVVYPFQSQCNIEAQQPLIESNVPLSNQSCKMRNNIQQDNSVPVSGVEPEHHNLPNLMAGIHLSKNNPNVQPSADVCADVQQQDIPKNSFPTCYQSNEAQINRQAEAFSNSSINSHDISSISRSSTPDGLRMTIDSDASLGSQDHSGLAQEQAIPLQLYRLRHSSPTQFTSSPYDEANKLTSHRLKGCQAPSNGALAGSYLADDGINEGVEEKDCSLDVTLCEESMPPEDLSRTVIGEEGEQASSTPLQQNPMTTADGRVPALCFEKILAGTEGAEHTNLNHVPADDNSKSGANFISHQPLYEPTQGRQPQPVSKPLDSPDNSGHTPVTSEEKFQSLYVWTTTHVSRNACPPAWTHPLKLVQTAQGYHEHNQQDSPRKQHTKESKGKQCSALPLPLPVTCPFQHLHKWDAEKTLDVSDVSGSLEFQHGMLKVVISEGIVYRFVTVAKIHIVEIHPGDGSVIVSQGVKGHFYTHYIIAGDRLEERTYSLKSLPPVQRKESYSISKLIQTGNRYLRMNQQWERRGLKQELPCWKREMVAVVEPLSSSLLEECVVDGLGKFSAFTNGRVRAVFEDRTALDMVCNFSKRLSGSLQRSHKAKTSLPAASQVTPPVSSYEAIFGASSARLLLPSGQYVTVDIQNPGQYRSYIQASTEWASWVNSTPMERHQFYTQKHEPTVMKSAAEHELKKIFCFNYILEQTLLMQQDSSSSNFTKGESLSPPRQNILSSSTVYPVEDASVKQLLPGNNLAPQQDFSYGHGVTPFSPMAQGQSTSNQSACHRFANKNQNNSRQFVPTPHFSAGSVQISQRPFINAKHPPGTDVNSFNRGNYPPSSIQLDPLQSRGTHYHTNSEMLSVANWMAQSDERAQSITDGFQAVRQVLLRNSNLINDIDEFLDNSRKQDLFDSS